jgi:uncharacterized protein
MYNSSEEITRPTCLVVIQPSPLCNINCRYCYLPNRLSTKRITPTILSRIYEYIFTLPSISDHLTIVWHAGEPLTLPISFYEKAFQYLDQYNTRRIQVTHSFQTNGTLINQKWCDFIKQYHVKIGVSLDGPQHIHDLNRVDRSEKGTFERTMRGVRLLQENNIDASIIMVLTRYALDYPDEIWQFFREHHLTRICFNIEEIEGVNKQSSLGTSEAIDQYKHFFGRLLTLRETCQEESPFIRELDLTTSRIKLLTRPVWSSENTPMAILSFDSEGNVSTFSPELLTARHENYGNFVFTNVNTGISNDMQAGFNQKFVNACAEIQNGISKCKETCEYFAFCGGGAPSNKLHENGTFDSTETMRCKLRIKALIDVYLEHFESKYGLNEYRELSITKRIAKIGEHMSLSRMNSSSLLQPNSEQLNQSDLFEQIHWDNFDDWNDRW